MILLITKKDLCDYVHQIEKYDYHNNCDGNSEIRLANNALHKLFEMRSILNIESKFDGTLCSYVYRNKINSSAEIIAIDLDKEYAENEARVDALMDAEKLPKVSLNDVINFYQWGSKCV